MKRQCQPLNIGSERIRRQPAGGGTTPSTRRTIATGGTHGHVLTTHPHAREAYTHERQRIFSPTAQPTRSPR
jgi:hypothetical protein